MLFALMLVAGFSAWARDNCPPPIIEIPQGTTRVVCIGSSEHSAPSNVQSLFFGYRAPIFSVRGKTYAVLAVDYAVRPGSYDFTFWEAGGADTTHSTIRVVRSAFPVRVTQLGPRRPTVPDFARDARIAEDLRIKERVFSVDARSPEKLWFASYRLPLAVIQITSEFGTRRIFRRKGERDVLHIHQGTDLRVCFPKKKCSLPAVHSVGGGRVIYATPNNRPFVVSGGTVIIDHGQGIASVYLHLSKTAVMPGQMVSGDEKIGVAGGTGEASRGPHLHIEIRVWNSHVDPLQFIKAMNEVLH